ncbi:MAG: hypothetical protein ACFFE5_00800 [Candidatus Thorarchaeota archaeon]
MQVQSRYISIACPSCGSEKTITVPETLFTDKKFGHVKIQVPKGAVCQEHVFVVLLDIKGRILGYQTVDLSVSTQDAVISKEEAQPESDESLGLIKFIKLLGFRCLAGLIHSKVFNYQPYIIIQKDVQMDMAEVNFFLDDIVPEIYRNHKVLKNIEYNDYVFPTATYFYALVKNQRKAAFLMNLHKHIIQMPWQTGLELEKGFITTALKNKDPIEQLKYLRFYISKFIEDADKTKIIVEPNKKISKKEIVKKLKEIAITSTVTKEYITSIKEFIHRRVSREIAAKIHD